ncbi:hypothetical protein ACFY4K_23740 [Streptomyces leeuwenhoekii]|uniref:hypothetical protein n=1 Tax=Streptomyces leeuwenhoekii TaxID=1437453 RepID=UPI003686ECDD
MRFEAVRQVRGFPSYRGQRDFSGWYWAATSTELVAYESWVELSDLMLLDADPEVVGVATQPFRARAMTPEPARPGWSDGLRMSRSVLSYARPS